ncbi:MAG: DUF481 domain-containing protein [Candidatus Hydrogenedens sp.]
MLFSILKVSFGYSDHIELTNGDTLTGQILKITNDHLTLNNDILGTINIKRVDIKKIEQEGPWEVSLLNGEVIQGKMNFTSDMLFIIEKGKKQSIPWENIQKITPVPENSATQETQEQKDKRKWSGSGKVLASLQKGTTDTTNFESSITVSGKRKKDLIEMKLSGAYGEVENAINTRRYDGKFRYQYYPEEKWYIYTDMGAERDEGRKLGLRGQIGGGTGYEIISQPRQTWSMEGALMLTHEEWLPYVPFQKSEVKQEQIQDGLNQIITSSQRLIQNPADIANLGGILGGSIKVLNPLNAENTTNDFTSLKIGSKYTRKIMSSELSHDLTFEPSLERIDYYRINSLTNLSTPVSKNMSVELTLSNEYDSEHQKRDIEPWEHCLSAGIKYEFGNKD